MVTRRKSGDYWTEGKRIVIGKDGKPVVKQTICCCKMPLASRRECSDAAGNKTPCRCHCHSKKL